MTGPSLPRRRVLGALGAGAVGLGALGLTGCTRTGRDADPSAAGSPAAGPSAGAPTPPAITGPAVDPTPTLLDRPAEVVEPGTLRLPLEMTVMIVVDPGWTAAPQQLDGIFLGHRTGEDAVHHTAVREDGQELWTAARPLGAETAVLTRSPDGTALAVLADRDGTGTTTLTALDLRTAETVWGPVPVPAAPLGPGLLVTAADGTARTLLDPATGETALAEAELGGTRLLAEHLGTALLLDGTGLVARDLARREDRWRLPLPAGLDPATAALRAPLDTTTDLAVLTGGGTGVLLDLARGTVRAEDVTAAAHDHAMDCTVVVSGTTVRGLASDGTEQWRHRDPEPLVLRSAGERLAYAQRPEEGTLVVLDTGQGRMVDPYDVDLTGPLAVPELFSADAATSVHVEQDRYLVTTTLDEGYGLRG